MTPLIAGSSKSDLFGNFLKQKDNEPDGKCLVLLETITVPRFDGIISTSPSARLRTALSAPNDPTFVFIKCIYIRSLFK